MPIFRNFWLKFKVLWQNRWPQALSRAKFVTDLFFSIHRHKNLSESVGIFLGPVGLTYGSFIPTLGVTAGTFSWQFDGRLEGNEISDFFRRQICRELSGAYWVDLWQILPDFRPTYRYFRGAWGSAVSGFGNVWIPPTAKLSSFSWGLLGWLTFQQADGLLMMENVPKIYHFTRHCRC